MRWNGQIQPQFTETYTFFTTSDDGVRLTVNGQRIIDNLTDHGPTVDTGTIALVAGQGVEVQLEFFENTGGAEIRLEWASASTLRQVVPRSQLFPVGQTPAPPPAPALFAAKVNFQPIQAPTVLDHQVDDGAVFGLRASGQSYGWNLDNSSTARDRNAIADQRFDTFQHMQKPENADARWEIAVPIGTYAITLGVGDPVFTNSVHRIAVEGTLVANFTPATNAAVVDRTRTFSATLTVSDGRLTVSNAAGASNNKVAFIEIQQVTTTAQ